jgi:hypothetical protein
MMALHGESGEQAQQDWNSRSAKKRAELSLSIEETLADNALLEDHLEDPVSEEVDESLQVSKSSVIIPPKLSLQSKPLPAVHVELKDVTNVTSNTTTESVAVPRAVQKKRRLAGRTTKVHLQAVPKSEKKAGGKIAVESEKNAISSDGAEHIQRKNNSMRNSLSENGALAKGNMEGLVQRSLAGSGILKQGQQEVVVTNAHISSSSVVVVTMVEDPGPVVIKYISLRPQTGFTVHFSALAEVEARFNYVILMGELF